MAARCSRHRSASARSRGGRGRPGRPLGDGPAAAARRRLAHRDRLSTGGPTARAQRLRVSRARRRGTHRVVGGVDALARDAVLADRRRREARPGVDARARPASAGGRSAGCRRGHARTLPGRGPTGACGAGSPHRTAMPRAVAGAMRRAARRDHRRLRCGGVGGSRGTWCRAARPRGHGEAARRHPGGAGLDRPPGGGVADAVHLRRAGSVASGHAGRRGGTCGPAGPDRGRALANRRSRAAGLAERVPKRGITARSGRGSCAR